MGSMKKALALLLLVGCAAEAPADPAESSTGATCGDEAACATADPLAESERPFVLAPARVTKHPILLHHGFNASRSNGWSFYGVVEALARDGQEASTTEVEPFHGVPVRAATLAKQVDAAIATYCAHQGPEQERCKGRAKVNLIAHSMGGLDARWLISKLGYGDRIATLTTISSPHAGSAIADAALGLLAPDRVNSAVSALAGYFGKRFTAADLAEGSDLRAALTSLSEANAAAFAAQTPDDPRVEYQSWAGVSRLVGGPRSAASQEALRETCEGLLFGSAARADFMNAQLSVPGAVVGRFGEDFQDGMVTVQSAKHGTFRGCFPADHLDEVGQPNREGPVAYTGFDHRVFYRNLATDLAQRGY